MLQSILLIGVTGPLSFGQFVVESLISQQRTHFNRLAVYHDTSRPPDEQKVNKLSRYKELGVEIISSHGYESADAFIGFDCVLSFLGNHALHLQPKIFDLAIEAGVRHFYPSEYGADLMVGQNRTQRYYKYKIAVREHLERRGLEIPDLGWTYFMLGRLTEWSVFPQFGIDNKKFAAKVYGTADGRQSLLAVRDAAAYIVATLKAPLSDDYLYTVAGKENNNDDDDDKNNNHHRHRHRRSFRISGSSPTYAEIFATLKAVREQDKEYDVIYVDVEQAAEEEREAKVKGDAEAELKANHKLIQGRQGTLLPEPWDNSRFPDVGPLSSVEEALRAAYRSNMFRRAYGLPEI